MRISSDEVDVKDSAGHAFWFKYVQDCLGFMVKARIANSVFPDAGTLD